MKSPEILLFSDLACPAASDPPLMVSESPETITKVSPSWSSSLYRRKVDGGLGGMGGFGIAAGAGTGAGLGAAAGMGGGGGTGSPCTMAAIVSPMPAAVGAELIVDAP